MISKTLAYAGGVVSRISAPPLSASIKTKIPAAFSARRDLESLALLFSGYPIGEPRRNNRYRDNNDYYNDVENKSADAQFHPSAMGREV
jgi:hypothetical protein